MKNERIKGILVLVLGVSAAAILTGCETTGGDGNYDQRAPIYTQGEQIDADYYDQLKDGN